MARELSPRYTRVVMEGDDSAPTVCKMDYRVAEVDGVNDDLFEVPKVHTEATPNFDQALTLLCTGTGTTVKGIEGIA